MRRRSLLFHPHHHRDRVTTSIPMRLLLAFILLVYLLQVHAFLQQPSTTTNKVAVGRFRKHHPERQRIITNDDDGCCLWMGLSPNSRNDNEGLKIAVVGAGPSGLLLSHLLLKDKNSNHKVTVLEGRSDPRSSTSNLEGRAYALGLGIRGRTAIRSCDASLWEAVKSRGYESERFNLHLGIFPNNKDLVIPLRSDSSNRNSDDANASVEKVEPSLLIYQSELCTALLDELEAAKQDDAKNDDDLEVYFDTRVVDCDLDAMLIQTLPLSQRRNATTTTDDDATTTASLVEEEERGHSLLGPFDLIVGCDGVNSQVRASIDVAFPEFVTTTEQLPGLFKVVRLAGDSVENESVSSFYDPKAVKLLLPPGAFIEPTGDDGSCCILFSSSNSNPPRYLTETQNATAVQEALTAAFPLWKETAISKITPQLIEQRDCSSASAITCNTYHYGSKAVLVGDAAHATGGISGQGVNSALVDVSVLAESLGKQADNSNNNTQLLDAVLFEYSAKQVLEGRALYDLSFGPKPRGLQKKAFWALKNVRDALFRGKLLGIGQEPLQTRLSSETTSFAEIRRERDFYYNNNELEGDDELSFPNDDEFRKTLEALHNKQ